VEEDEHSDQLRLWLRRITLNLEQDDKPCLGPLVWTTLTRACMYEGRFIVFNPM